MANFVIIPSLTGEIINAPLLILNIIINLFYALALIFPPHSGQRKQPLTFLLGFLISCTLFYCASLTTLVMFIIFQGQNRTFFFIFPSIISVTTDFSMVSYVWLNFYYCVQIVPAPCALFHWIKRNIKWALCAVLSVDVLIVILNKIIIYVKFLIIISFPAPTINNTAIINSFERSRKASFYMTTMHYSVMLCISVTSSLSTVCYLHKHMKNMEKSGSSFSAARLRGQMRVTITGICQGILFFLHGSYLLFHGFTFEYSKEIHFHPLIMFTATTLFISGTTLTLGIGQTVFRQRCVNMYKELKCVSICQKTK